MEALFQIGKDLGALTARVSALEVKGGCNCHSSSAKGIPISELSNEQREILLALRKNHKALFTRLDAVLKEFGLGDKVKISQFRVIDARVQLPSVSEGSEDCCYCCQNEGVSGWDMCCSRDCSPCCA